MHGQLDFRGALNYRNPAVAGGQTPPPRPGPQHGESCRGRRKVQGTFSKGSIVVSAADTVRATMVPTTVTRKHLAIALAAKQPLIRLAIATTKHLGIVPATAANHSLRSTIILRLFLLIGPSQTILYSRQRTTHLAIAPTTTVTRLQSRQQMNISIVPSTTSNHTTIATSK